MKKPYLFLYNLISCIGWAYVLSITAQSLLAQHSPELFWKNVELPLKIVQTMAFLEVVHSFMRLVPSPVFSTLLQVASRLVLLWGYTNTSSVSQNHWTLYLMVGSWSLVEVPRYAFYAINLISSKVPYPLFFLRYNLFSVLYPTGISGEIGQILCSLKKLKETCLGCWYASALLLLIYIPGSPFMYTHMIAQRKRAEAKRKQAGSGSQQKFDGVEYPEDEKGERGTTPINKGAYVAALKAVDEKAAKECERERNWRFGYAKHINKSVEIGLQSPEKCLKMAKAGLDYLHNNFEFFRNGKSMKFSEAMSTITGSFETGFIQGTKKKPEKFEFTVPYNDEILKGEALLKQLDKWANYGTIEPDVRDAIAAVVKNEKWIDLSDKYFVLLGAGSAMGPIQVLLDLGANVIAIDLDRPHIWERLIGLARNSCGTITFPLKKPQKELTSDKELYANAGCNLFTNTPEIANWLLTVHPGKQLVIGGYAYLDGALFLKVSIAMDAIIKKVTEHRKDTALAFLCTPTDVHVIPEDAHNAMLENYKKAPSWQKLIEKFGFLKKNAKKQITALDGTKFSLVDGLVIPQGPNYALSKRLQHWRCMIARSEGHIVSTNIAPSTATKSVVSNKSFAAAYGGMHHFKPMEVFYQETSNSVMAALLIFDIRSPTSIANPQNELKNPLELFSKGSFHGGIWRMAYRMNSIGPISALAFYAKTYSFYLTAFVAGMAGFVAYAVKNPPHTWF